METGMGKWREREGRKGRRGGRRRERELTIQNKSLQRGIGMIRNTFE
jgi:hypothetical protein